MTTVLVCGGRDFDDRNWLDQMLWAFHNEIDIRRIVHGDGRGADKLAGAWGRRAGVTVVAYPADWDDIEAEGAVIRYHNDGKAYNAKAGSARNQQMLDEEDIDLVIAFPGGVGTADMVRRAKQAGVKVIQLERP